MLRFVKILLPAILIFSSFLIAGAAHAQGAAHDLAIDQQNWADYVRSHGPLEVNSKANSCVGAPGDKYNKVELISNGKVIETYSPYFNSVATLLLLNCGQAFLRAQQAKSEVVQINYLEFVGTERWESISPNVPKSPVLVSPATLSIRPNPFSANFPRILYVGELPVIEIQYPNTSEVLNLKIENAKLKKTGIELDYANSTVTIVKSK
jgi:hypothetical protein